MAEAWNWFLVKRPESDCIIGDAGFCACYCENSTAARPITNSANNTPTIKFAERLRVLTFILGGRVVISTMPDHIVLVNINLAPMPSGCGRILLLEDALRGYRFNANLTSNWTFVSTGFPLLSVAGLHFHFFSVLSMLSSSPNPGGFTTFMSASAPSAVIFPFTDMVPSNPAFLASLV